MYAELTYFDGAHFAHIAARDEHRRLQRKREEAAKAVRGMERRTGGRATLAPVRLMLAGILLLAYGAVILWAFAELSADRPSNLRIGLAVASMIVLALFTGGALTGGGM